MRLYRFLNAHWGLLALQAKRIRIGRIAELNDDFEFIGIALDDKAERKQQRAVRDRMHSRSGIICMAKDWSSPLMWAHYADSYKGMAIGFEVPSKAFYKVNYVKKRPTKADLGITRYEDISIEQMKEMTRVKASGWRYEQEYRSFINLEQKGVVKEGDNYFQLMNDNFMPIEVIVGPRTPLKKSQIIKALGPIAGDVDIFMSRGDFADFKVVRQNQDSMWR